VKQELPQTKVRLCSAADPRTARRAVMAASAGLLLSAPAYAQGTPVIIGRDGWLFSIWESSDRVDQSAMREVLDLHSHSVRILQAGGIQVVYCLIPAKSRIYRRFLPASVRLSPAIERRYSTVAAALQGTGALVPDLLAPLAEASARDPHWPVFFKSDTHWTPVGAAIAAVTIAAQMRAGLRLPPARSPGVQLGETRMMRLARGDLVQYVPANRQDYFGAEESPMRPIVSTGNPGSLLDEDAADVQIIGTSNVQPRFGFQSILSNQLVRQVGLSWLPNNQGPYAAMLEYLRSAEFRQRRPRAIVWNHLETDMATLLNTASWRDTGITAQSFLAALRRAAAA